MRFMPAGMKEALAMSDALQKELPRMLAEHKQIRAAKQPVHAKFAEDLAAHARSEEEIFAAHG